MIPWIVLSRMFITSSGFLPAVHVAVNVSQPLVAALAADRRITLRVAAATLAARRSPASPARTSRTGTTVPYAVVTLV